jgi:uncharacterized oxidoreductase
MKTTGNTILITGGATGIGLATATAFVNAGNDVIICGRRAEKLQEAQDLLPSIQTRACDISSADDRAALFEWVSNTFGNLNILINNAGIQRMIDLTKGEEDLLDPAWGDEIDINFKATVFLSAKFIPVLAAQEESAIINVSSALGWIPISVMPVYCATKAAIHSFTMSLRHQLRKTSIKVIEVIPPTVDTELDRGARAERGQQDLGIPASEVADALLAGMENENFEICVGRAQGLKDGSQQDFESMFRNMNRY